MIKAIEHVILEGGRDLNLVYRGIGKTSISACAAVWAVVYGHRKYIAIFGADATLAANILDSIKTELSENPRLEEDFSEVVGPIIALEGKPQRCNSQTCGGKLTHITWRADKLVFPTTRQKWGKADGSIVVAKGITASGRGMQHKTTDGAVIRPDLTLIDDPQTDESADSPNTVKKRIDILQKSVLKLAGHKKRIACIVNATVIQPNDMVDQLSKPKDFPSWQVRRFKMIKQWADLHDPMWMDKYASIRNDFDPTDEKSQAKAHKEATKFYRKNRKKMDAGCQVSWEGCFDETEISAIQHAYNILIDDGEEAFQSECQNEPVEKETDKDQLKQEEVTARCNGLKVKQVPNGAKWVVGSIDVQKRALFWVITAFDEYFSPTVIDYGCYPEQGKRHYVYAQSKKTLQNKYKGMGDDEVLHKGLEDLSTDLLGREFKRVDGGTVYLDKLMIDRGYQHQIIHSVIRKMKSSIVSAVMGIGITASRKPLNEYIKKAGEKKGHNWRRMTTDGEVYILSDANYWKAQIIAKIRTPFGGKGALTIFGKNAKHHALFADHLCGEMFVETKGHGRTLLEFKQRGHRDQHWLDCLGMAFVGASMLGAVSGGVIAKVQKKRKKRKNVSYM